MASIWSQEFMKQTATYWAPGALDEFAQPSFSVPVSISCRWQDEQEKFIDDNGDERLSLAVVYPDRVLARGGWLYLGTSAEADPNDVSGAFMIKKTRTVPDLSANLEEVKVWL